MSHYKAYPECKESGAELIGNIPKDWELKRLRHVAIFNNSNVDKKSYDDQADVKLCNYTDVYYNEFITPDLEFMNATASESEIEKFRLAEGDVIITKDSEDPNDIGIPALVKQDMHDVVCGYHLTVIKSHEFDLSGFIHRSIQSHPTKAHFFVESPGITRFGLDQDAIGDIPVCIPPKEHRSTIVSAINTEINRINTLITKKTRFIELLKEKRQALITHAVTKGLNPDVKMKDSGVEWIGEVPEHWQIAQLRRLVSINNGSDHKAIEADEGFPVYGSGGAFAYATDYIYDGESVLLGRKGTIDKPLYVNEKFWTVDTMYWTKIMPIANGKFCYYVAKTIPFDYYASNTALPSMTQTDLGSHVVAFPDKVEQSLIASALDRETSRIDTLISKTLKSISLLKERRSAFITAAVTGQIDLRGEPV
ncbi:TPA: restriction endonuclease subunit S [Proteus mirabilis]